MCFGLGNTADIPHFCVKEKVFVKVCFVHKHSVNTDFFKGNNIVLAFLVIELFYLCFKPTLCLFHLLNRVTLRIFGFCLCNTIQNLIKLILQYGFLPFCRHRYFFKLTMTDNDRIIITRCDTTAEFLAVFHLKIFLCCNKDICRRIKLQKFACPLFDQVVGYYKQRFIAKSEPP